MSYAQRRQGRSNTALVTVAGLHALAAYALVSGFGVRYVEQFVPGITAGNIPAEPPPPEPAPPEHSRDDAAEPTMAAPPARTIQPSDAAFRIRPMPDIEIELPPIPEARPEPTPSPAPSAVPAGARPSNRPETWVSTSDYPSRDLREGNAGVVGFTLAIGTDGKVEGCSITQSSGHPGLDQATCRTVTRKARFEPATDAQGLRVPGAYAGRIRWVIPD